MENDSGVPISLEMSRAISSVRASSASAAAASSRDRSAGAVCDHEAKAPRAAATARSTSSASPAGIDAICSSVAGSTTGMGVRPVAGTHWPPM